MKHFIPVMAEVCIYNCSHRPTCIYIMECYEYQVVTCCNVVICTRDVEIFDKFGSNIKFGSIDLRDENVWIGSNGRTMTMCQSISLQQWNKTPCIQHNDFNFTINEFWSYLNIHSHNHFAIASGSAMTWSAKLGFYLLGASNSLQLQNLL